MTIGIILVIIGLILAFTAGYAMGQSEGQKRAEEAYNIRLARQLGSSTMAARAEAIRRMTTPAISKGVQS